MPIIIYGGAMKEFSLVTRPGDKPKPLPQPEEKPKSLLVVYPSILEKGGQRPFEIEGLIKGLGDQKVRPYIRVDLPSRGGRVNMPFDPRVLIYDFHHLKLEYTPRAYASKCFGKSMNAWLKAHAGWGTQREIPMPWLDDVIRWPEYQKIHVPTLVQPLSLEACSDDEFAIMARQLAESVEVSQFKGDHAPWLCYWDKQALMCKPIEDDREDKYDAVVDRIQFKRPIAVGTCMPSFRITDEDAIERGLPLDREGLTNVYCDLWKSTNRKDLELGWWLHERQTVVGMIWHKSGDSRLWRAPREIESRVSRYPREKVITTKTGGEDGIRIDEDLISTMSCEFLEEPKDGEGDAR